MLHLADSDWVLGWNRDHDMLHFLERRSLLGNLVFKLLSVGLDRVLLPNAARQLVYFGEGSLQLFGQIPLHVLQPAL